ncbi:PXA domain-containing protein [Russula dissimulans]|nr:PXA domain-containing protein [Russula dissimulans]
MLDAPVPALTGHHPVTVTTRWPPASAPLRSHCPQNVPLNQSLSSKLTAPGVSLSKRLLFPHLASSSPTPPLLQTSSTYPALDAELYDLIALALRAYINPWWIKITRYDKQLLVELTRILSSVLRALEARALATDLNPLVYHDLPTLLAQHCADYRIAARKLGSSYAAAGSASLPMLFHGQQQHVGVSVDGRIDEVYVRAAVDIVLKACLSPEDWDAEVERYLIREVIVKTVCVDLAPRITQPWFLHSTVLGLLGPADGPLAVNPPSRFNTNSSLVPSLHTIIVSFLSAVQAISSTALSIIQIYKRTVHTIKTVHNSTPYIPPQPPVHASHQAPEVTTAPSPSPSPSPSPPDSSSTPREPSPSQSVVASVSSHPNNANSPPLHLPSAADSHSPILLPLFLYTSVLTPIQITAVISAAKNSLFPSGYPAQSPPDPTLEERVVLRSELLQRLAQVIPGATPAARERTLSALLDPFDEQACNAHLFMLIFDLALLALFPEMAVGASDSGVGSP